MRISADRDVVVGGMTLTPTFIFEDDFGAEVVVNRLLEGGEGSGQWLGRGVSRQAVIGQIQPERYAPEHAKRFCISPYRSMNGSARQARSKVRMLGIQHFCPLLFCPRQTGKNAKRNEPQKGHRSHRLRFDRAPPNAHDDLARTQRIVEPRWPSETAAQSVVRRKLRSPNQKVT